jgi:pimeloyl-ACP methyl ester carboxylesterase
MKKAIVPDLQFVTHMGKKIAYRENGKGSPILFLHGMNGNSRSWAELFNSLGEQFRVIAWDAPSFGKSDVFGDSIIDYNEAAKALVKALDLKEIIVVGHSMGGLIATRLAAEKELSVSGLILSSCHLGFGLKKGEALMSRYAERIDILGKIGPDKSYALERARRSTPEGTPHYVVEFLADVARNTRVEGIRDGGRMSQETDNSDICSDIKVPVLILSGSRDKIISKTMHESLVKALPQAEQFIFSGAGHASYVECPELFRKQIEVLANKVWKQKELTKET